MKKRRIIQPILWTERPTGAVMGAGSLWPLVTRPRTGTGQHRFAWWYLQLCTSRWLILHWLLINKLLSTPMDVMWSLMSVSHCRQPKVLWKKAAWYWKGLMINNPKIGHLLYTVLLPSALREISKPCVAVFQLLLTINSRSFYHLYTAATKVAM
jgi:hypothetical protein